MTGTPGGLLSPDGRSSSGGKPAIASAFHGSAYHGRNGWYIATGNVPSVPWFPRPLVSRALVVQADQLGTGLAQTIVAMITSNMARARHPSRVVVRIKNKSGSGSGLLMDSVIMTDNLATIHDSEIDQVIGAFTGLGELDAALRATLAL